ncbi:uncharacterized protein LOC130731105 isoform X2 [Lotus japonicus]|uniref:uncharacterized protein LOC130731105 isoform X2 n=1 Tax=Lotus japonicus TaxID=34305 RepID=UPI00258B3F76|nr:uncharacterized protein LOC130731105 isoform X2 [Lotus japonicus]
MASSTKQVMVIGVDDSEYSTYALEWTLDHLVAPLPNNPIFKIVLVYAKPSVATTVGFVGPGIGEVIPVVDADLKRTAAKVTDRAKELCVQKSVTDVTVEVIEGDARNVLCDVVEKHHASILVVGSHGYGAIKRISPYAGEDGG